MLAELQERDAAGEVATIYDEIRRFCAVPYVSSRPALASGCAQTAAWRAGASFVRASPTNLVLSGLLRRLLSGERPAGRGGAEPRWTPPPLLLALPSLVDMTALPPAERGVLMSLGVNVGGQPFVPGLYRLLARWPTFLAHVATDDPATRGLPAARSDDRRRDPRRLRHAAGAAGASADAAAGRVRRPARRIGIGTLRDPGSSSTLSADRGRAAA